MSVVKPTLAILSGMREGETRSFVLNSSGDIFSGKSTVYCAEKILKCHFDTQEDHVNHILIITRKK